MTSSQSVDVAIIGAGISGLAAAGILLKTGFNVIILEASSQIGGRVRTVNFGGTEVDLGAHWIGGDPIYNLGKENDLIVDSRAFANLHFVFPNETILLGSRSEELTAKMGLFAKDVGAMSEHVGSLGSYFTKKFQEDGQDLGLTEAELSAFISWVHKFKCLEHGCNSLNEAKTATILKRGPRLKCALWKNGGFSELISLLIEKCGGSQILRRCLKLDCEVLRIDWSDPIKVKLTTTGGAYNVDHVIVTVPLAVLKEKHSTMFTPTLPEVNIRAMNDLDMGTVDKIFLKYSTRWWPVGFSGFCFAIDGIPECQEGLGWEKSLIGVFAEDTAPLILCGWVVGDAAREMESQSDEEVSTAVTRVLKMYLGKTYNVPVPESIMRSSWFSDPKFRGSYSYYALGGDDNAPERLSTPVSNKSSKQVIFISGEATSPANFSTAHGALESGWRVAERIRSLHPDNLKAHCTKIVIIGAGLAGLAAARMLLSRGVTNFKILEAQDSPGGRVKTKVLGSGFIEMGAQWAHVSNSSMCDFAKSCNLISTAKSIEGAGVYFCPGGQRVSPALVAEVRNVVVNILSECFDFYGSDEGNEPDNVGDFMDMEFNKYLNSCNHGPDDTSLKRALYDWIKRFEVIDNSCNNLRDLSSRLWGQFGDPDTEQDHINVQGGFSSLIDSLVELVPPEALVTSCPVERVHWDTSPCQIRCSDGRSFAADHVLITCSIGYLQENLSLFHPPLPQDYQHAIQNIGFGTINKIFLFYDEEWWKDLQGVQLVWDSQERLSFFTEEMSWVRGLTGFDPVLTCKNVLLGWVGGPGAVECEDLTDEQVADHCTIVLREFTGSRTLPRPQSIIRSRWNSNKYVRGAYCHLTPNTACCHPQDTLLQPLSYDHIGEKQKPVLFFAGEALHKKYYSTANGAYDCGEEQALSILDCLGR